jgi:hypothetical protein
MPLSCDSAKSGADPHRELTASVGSSAISSPAKITKLPAQVFSSVSPCR